MKYDWIKIKNYYLTHEISLEDLAKKYKVSVSSVNKRCRKEQWVNQKKESCQEIDKRVSEKLTEKEVDKKVKANELHTELYDKGLAVANLILDRYLASLLEGKKRTGATATNLDYLMSAIAKCQKGQRMSLNIEVDDTGDTEPEVRIISGLDINKI